MNKNIIRRFYTYEEDFKSLKSKKVWARSIDVLYRFGVAGSVLYFGYILYTDNYLHDLFSSLYALVAMTTVLTGGILAYHVLLYSLLYVLYGSEFQNNHQGSKNSLSVFLVVITGIFIITSFTWLYLGP